MIANCVICYYESLATTFINDVYNNKDYDVIWSTTTKRPLVVNTCIKNHWCTIQGLKVNYVSFKNEKKNYIYGWVDIYPADNMWFCSVGSSGILASFKLCYVCFLYGEEYVN